MTQIHGTCHDDFVPVREAFEKNFSERGDLGASVAVSYQGEVVVDLWGGHRDREATQPWEEDTIVNVYSSTKTMAALCLLVLADRGEVDLYEKVANYWPEFAQNGKDTVEVRHFLSHSAGLAGMDDAMTAEDAYDWDKMIAALERQAPWWEPGTASGYHALTQGYLIGEVVRRVTGQSLGAFFRAEIAGPLDADFHIGTPRDAFARIAELDPPASAPASEADADSIAARTFRSPAISAHAAATDGWRLAEIPAANGHGNARSIVRVQTAVANLGSAFGVNLLSEAGARRVFDEQTNGRDLVLGVPIRFGMGYGLTSDVMPMGPNEHIAYWGGWGCSSVVVDQDARLCVSYVMNRMAAELLGDMRGFSILQGAYASLA
jgi:CubicO group peptidase (beta-lactamase class C family)